MGAGAAPFPRGGHVSVRLWAYGFLAAESAVVALKLSVGHGAVDAFFWAGMILDAAWCLAGWHGLRHGWLKGRAR
jgi:hypothetical protein